MEEVNVKDLEHEENNTNYQQDIIKSIVKKRLERKEYENQPTKKPNNTTFKLKTVKQNLKRVNKISKEEENELFGSMKEGIFEVLTVPMKDPNKKPILKKKLKKSPFMNRFTKETLFFDYLSKINDKAKFALIYSYYYTTTLLDLKFEEEEDKKKKGGRKKKEEIEIEEEEEL